MQCTNRKPFTGRGIAVRTARGVVNVHRVLNKLVAAGVVEVEQKVAAKPFRIAQDNVLVARVLILLFEGEARVEDELWDALAPAGEKKVVALVLFGSRAREAATGRSDIDVPVVVAAQADVEELQERALQISLRYGADVQAICVSIEELRSWALANARL